MIFREPAGDRVPGQAPGERAGSPGESSSGWYVLIYESTGTHHGRKLSQVLRVGPDHGEAVRSALRIIAEYKPGSPAMPRSRQAFQTSPDSWTVRVEGMASAHSFDVKIAWRVL